MIVFLGFPVKNKRRKVELWQALTVTPIRFSNVLVLASSSPYRRLLLERLRVPYSSASPELDESPLAGEAPPHTAVRLAEAKARAVAARFPGAIVIGSDQVAVLDGAPLGKPGTHAAALAQLLAMRGRSVVFHTALCVLDPARGTCRTDEVPTTVQFREYSHAQAERYLEIEKPYDCAGSAKIEAMGIALVEKVVSTDPTALIGLPLIALVSLLREAGVEVL
jgi:septum formation protein